jgi:hypothetical protein
MTSIQARLYDHLRFNPGVAALVAARIYPVRMPQQPTLPCITYIRVDGVPQYTHSGRSDLVQSRLQISCWATTYAAAIALADAVKASIDSFPENATVEAFPDMYDPETQVYHVPVDIITWYKE